MNFMRKKPSTPLDELSLLYNDVATKTIQNLAYEQKGDFKRATQGWKGLHTNLLYKMDIINKSFASHTYTFEEQNLREGIEELMNKGLDHLDRVNALYEQSDQYERPSQITSRNPSSTYTVPTLRSSSPQGFSVRHAQQPEVPKPRLLKTLRADKPHKFHSPNNYKSPSSSLTSTSRTNFTTSKSVNSTPRTQRTSTEIDIFDKSFEDDLDFDLQSLRRNEALFQLEAAGQHSKSSRARTIEDLPTQLDSLKFEGFDCNNTQSTPNLLEMKPRTLDPKLKAPSPQNINVPRSSSPKKLVSSSIATSKSVPTAIPKPKPVIRQTPTSKHAPIKKAAPVPTFKPTVTRTIVKPAPKPQQRPLAKQVASTTAAKSAASAKPSPKSQQKPTARLVKPGTRPVKPPTTTKPPNASRPASKPRTSSSPKPRQRSESPMRNDTKDTETISSASSGDNVDGMDLSEKEVREKMEDQIIEGIRGIDYNAAKQIFNEIVVRGDEVHWDDIAGLETAKTSLKETVVYPFLRPDLFSGLREPARGMLLFGPPGTGKTMIARAVATESKSTFFSISASSLTSKYLGESEKLVRALFMLAKELSPSIIFVDEIDSLLSSRTDGDAESSRRIKNEFLVQWSDLTHAAAGKDHGEDLQRVLVLAATNLPWAIDEAARRRFVRRQYIPLPEGETRLAQVKKLLAHQKHTLNEKDQNKLVDLTEGFSGSDITALAKDAAMGPLRSLGDRLLSTAREEIRPIGLEDFESSLRYIRPSVSKENLSQFDDWAAKFGSSGV